MPPGGRVRTKPVRDPSPVSIDLGPDHYWDLPDISVDESFRVVVKKLSFFFVDAIELPSTFEQLRTTSAGDCLRVLVDHLGDGGRANPYTVHALLALKWHYAAEGEHQHHGLGEARANACEIVAWRFLTRLSEREAVDYCLVEIPNPARSEPAAVAGEAGAENGAAATAAGRAAPPETIDLEHAAVDETTALLLLRTRNSHSPVPVPAAGPGHNAKRIALLSSLSLLTVNTLDEDRFGGTAAPAPADPTAPFTNLNALEIAAIADAKRFLSQHIVQKIINGLWSGDIVFWDSLSVGATKRPRLCSVRAPPDPFSRLRVPKYLKCWEVLFFAAFMALYYGVLIEQSQFRITPTEIGLYLWLAAFTYDELSEWLDAGSIFYATDLWNLFDMIMIAIGLAFAVLRVIGIYQHDPRLVDVAYDVLALEALFMMPRICSLLSLSPYWGTLIPCLKEMGKDFVKFMILIIVIYCGFLTTFCLIGRDHFSSRVMSWRMLMIFFGSNYLGFEMMDRIDPFFGPPLMIVFITLSSILLMGSMTGMLSNSFSRVIQRAREEYLYVYSVYVLEASTSNRLTHFYPPFNLVALVLFRPLRYLCYAASSSASRGEDHHFRAGRIALLKATHWPIVAAIQLYELARRRAHRDDGEGDDDEFAGFKGPDTRARRAGHQRPRHATLRSRSRPTSASAVALCQRHTNRPPSWSARAVDHGYAYSARLAVPARARDDETGGEEPTVAETKIDELRDKIDRLTEVVLAMQQQQREQRQECGGCGSGGSGVCRGCEEGG